jgi:hypothetical protein
MPFRLKHVPTGMYYQPHRHRGNNISITGKIYHKEVHANSVKNMERGGGITIWVMKRSKICRDTESILVYFESRIVSGEACALTRLDDWQVEEMTN